MYLDNERKALQKLLEKSKMADESQKQVRNMRLEQEQLLGEFGQHKAMLDAVDVKEQEKIMDNIEKRKDPCPICREEIIERVRPNNCEHYFCLSCLKEATKTKSTCPCCRREFTRIEKERGPSIKVKSRGFSNLNGEQEFLRFV